MWPGETGRFRWISSIAKRRFTKRRFNRRRQPVDRVARKRECALLGAPEPCAGGEGLGGARLPAGDVEEVEERGGRLEEAGGDHGVVSLEEDGKSALFTTSSTDSP